MLSRATALRDIIIVTTENYNTPNNKKETVLSRRQEVLDREVG